MPGIEVNASLKLAVNAGSIRPAISAIENQLKSTKIKLPVSIDIPKDIDRQVYRLSNAFKNLDDRFRSLKFSTGEALANVKAFVQELSGLGAGFQKNLNAPVRNLNESVKTLNRLTSSTKEATKATGTLGEAIGVSAKRFSSFAIAAGIIANTVLQLKKGTDAALLFDRELVRLKQVGGDSASSLKDISDAVTKLSKNLGVSSGELIKTATTLRQAGLSINDVKIALDVLAKTELSPTFGSIANTTEGVIAILNQFKGGAGQLEKQLGALNRVAADFPVESEDLVEAIRRAGGAFAAAGGNLNELLALFTSVRGTTRESAESIATSFRTIFANLQKPSTIKNLKDIGIELTDMQGKFIGPYQAVRRLSEGLKELDSRDLRFAKVVEDIGGIRQVSKVIPLIQQFPVAVKAYNVALEGQNSLSKDAAIAQEAFLRKIDKVKESFLELFRVVSEDTSVRALLDLIISLTSSLTSLAKTLRGVVPLLVGLAAFKAVTVAKGFASDVRTGFRKTAFAGGGVVPDLGDTGMKVGTDTVPAMLSPGEFVVKKSSAQKIGYSNLHAMNKGITVNSMRGSMITDANGGWIRAEEGAGGKKINYSDIPQLARPDIDPEKESYTLKIKPPGGALGELVTSPGSNRSTPENVVVPIKAIQGSALTKIKKLLKSTVIPHDTLGVEVPISVRRTSKDAQKAVKKGVIGGLKIATSELGSPLGRINDAQADDIIQTSITNQGLGRMFEGTITAIVSKITGKKIGAQGRNFDLDPSQTKAVRPLFGLDNVFSDVKYNDTRDARASIAAKAIREFDVDRFVVGKRNLKKIITTGDKKSRVTGNYYQYLINHLNTLYTNKKFRNQIINPGEKFAQGGSVKALLTPGEFVFSADAAKRMGGGALNKLNQGVMPKGYASGGFIGLAGGGTKGKKGRFRENFIYNILTEGNEPREVIHDTAPSYKTNRSIAEQFGRIDEDPKEALLKAILNSSNRSHLPNPNLTNAKIANINADRFDTSTAGGRQAALLARFGEPSDSTHTFAPLESNIVDRSNVSRKHFRTTNFDNIENLSKGTSLAPRTSLAQNVKKGVGKLYDKIAGDLYKDLEEGAVEFKNINGKITANIKKGGRLYEVSQAKQYSGADAAKRIDRLKGDLSGGKIDALDLLSGRRGFGAASSKSTSLLGQFNESKLGNRAKIAGGVGLALTPLLAEKFLGTAETPGRFGTTGAKVGATAANALTSAGIGASLGASFGPLGAAIGGIIGGLTGAITGLKNFDKELEQVNLEKLNKQLNNIEINSNTGRILGGSNLKTLADNTVDTKFLGKSESEIENIIKEDFVKKGRSTFLSSDLIKQKAKDISAGQGSKLELIKPITQKAGESLLAQASNPKNAGKTYEQLLASAGNGIKEVLALDKEEATKIQNKIKVMNEEYETLKKLADIQGKAYLAIKDVTTAVEAFGASLEQAGEGFEKRNALFDVGAGAVGGKSSAGVNGPGLGLLGGKFGSQLEEFSKPGGGFDQSRVIASEAIKRALAHGTTKQETAGDFAESFFRKKTGGKNDPFTESIAKNISSVVSESFENTSKVPTEQLISDLTDKAIEPGKQFKSSGENLRKQAQAAFNVFSQRGGEARQGFVAANQKLGNVQNSAGAFGLENFNSLVDTFGQTQFVNGKAISANDLKNRAGVTNAQQNIENQLGALGIGAASGKGLRKQIGVAQSQLEAAQNRQAGFATQPGKQEEFKKASIEVLNLTTTISNLKKGMDILASSTELVTARQRSLAEAEQKAKDDISGRKSDALVELFGSQEEKTKLFQSKLLTEQVLQNPSSIQILNDEQKKAVQERLSSNNQFVGVQNFDKFGRARGQSFLNGQEGIDLLLQTQTGFLNDVNNSGGARFAQKNYNSAKRALVGAQNSLTEDQKQVGEFEREQAQKATKSNEESFNKYISDIQKQMAENNDVFKLFAEKADKLADSIDRMPQNIKVDNKQSIEVVLNGVQQLKGVENALVQSVVQNLIPQLQQLSKQPAINY